MTNKALHTAWVSLIGLSIASTLLSLPETGSHWPTASGLVVLLLAWQKARIILARYLGLSAAPAWRHGFNLALGALFLILSGLFLRPF
jgi:hypothetical protein